MYLLFCLLNDVILLVASEIRSCCLCTEEVEAKTVIVTGMKETESMSAVVTEMTAEAVHRGMISQGTAVGPGHRGETHCQKKTDVLGDVQVLQCYANGKLFKHIQLDMSLLTTEIPQSFFTS